MVDRESGKKLTLVGVYTAAIVGVVVLLVRLDPDPPPENVPVTFRAYGIPRGQAQLVSLWRGNVIFHGEESPTPQLEEGLTVEVAPGEEVGVDVDPPWQPGAIGEWGCEIRGSDGRVLANDRGRSGPTGGGGRAVCRANAE